MILRKILLFAIPLAFVACDDDEEIRRETTSTTVEETDSTDDTADSEEEEVEEEDLDLTINVNSNSEATDTVYMYLEMPHFNAENTFVAHRAVIEGDTLVNYSIEWNQSMLHAQWAAFSFDAYSSLKNTTRKENFVVDPDLPETMQVDNSYHTNDGFDRGHLCASNDRVYSEETNEQTFYFSNMSPQLNEFNTGIWQRLEEEVQAWGKYTQSGTYDKVYVCKGGTLNQLLINYTGTTTGGDGKTPTTDENGYTVKGLPCPAYYFMAILTEKGSKYNAIAFNINHSELITPLDGSDSFSIADLKQYVLSVDELEEFTGLDFFCNLPDAYEDKVEAEVDLDVWKW